MFPTPCLAAGNEVTPPFKLSSAVFCPAENGAVALTSPVKDISNFSLALSSGEDAFSLSLRGVLSLRTF
jgi:hypothetical protein